MPIALADRRPPRARCYGPAATLDGPQRRRPSGRPKRHASAGFGPKTSATNPPRCPQEILMRKQTQFVTIQPNAAIDAHVGRFESSKTHRCRLHAGGGSSKSRPTLHLRRFVLHSAEWLRQFKRQPLAPEQSQSRTGTKPIAHRNKANRAPEQSQSHAGTKPIARRNKANRTPIAPLRIVRISLLVPGDYEENSLEIRRIGILPSRPNRSPTRDPIDPSRRGGLQTQFANKTG